MDPEQVLKNAPGNPGAGGEGGAPGSEATVELHYVTWGSYGQFSRSMAVLRDGRLVDPTRFSHVGRGSTLRTKDGFLVEDRSSRKNTKIYVRVPADQVLAVIHESATSSGWKGFELSGPGEIVGELIEEERVDGNRRFVTQYRVYRYQNGDLKVLLKREKVGIREELIGRPRVEVRPFSDSLVIVRGDTYHIREMLKKLGAKWRPEHAVWLLPAEKLEALRQIAEVLEG